MSKKKDDTRDPTPKMGSSEAFLQTLRALDQFKPKQFSPDFEMMTNIPWVLIAPPGCCSESWHCSSSPSKVLPLPLLQALPPTPAPNPEMIETGQRDIWSLRLGSKRSSVLMILNVNRDEKAEFL